jgi:hypothetical protein
MKKLGTESPRISLHDQTAKEFAARCYPAVILCAQFL